MFERTTKLLNAFLERIPSILVPHTPELIALYMDAGLLRVSAADIQHMRPKRAYLILRLLCSFLNYSRAYLRGGTALTTNYASIPSQSIPGSDHAKCYTEHEAEVL